MAKQARAATNGKDSHQEHEAVFPPTSGEDESKGSDIAAKAATIVVIGAGAALISVELLPGMIIGVAAAFLPGIGPKMRPFLRSTVRATYAAARKTREAMAEAGEQIQDIVAEARAETKSRVS
jgi:hypothetical protein